ITYPDGSVDTIPGTDTVVTTTPTPQTDAEKNDLTNPTKTPVADTNNLTDDEKAKVKDEVEKSNPDLPSGTTITVGNDGTATITYPDGSTDTLTGTVTVIGTTPTPQTDAEKNDLTNPTKTPVADTNNLTEDEKAKVKEEVEKSNPNLPTGTTVEVGNDGTVTVTYPDGSVDTIPGTDTVATEPPYEPVPQTDAEKNGITNPTKTPVADTNNLTEEEKAKVKEEVEKSNPNLPSGTTIEVGNDGSVAITYPDGSIDIIPGADTVVPTTPVPQTDAEKNDVTNPAKTPVADTNNLTEDEKAKVKEEVEKSNPGLPTGTTIEVSNGGSVTITYPDGSIDIIPATDAVVPTTPTPQTDAEKNGIANPTKTPVADTNNLTEDEKAKVKEEVEKSNPGLPSGTTIVVGNDGSVTITYPDGSVDTISGTDTVTPNTDTTAPEAPIVNTPKAGDKTVTGTAEPGSTITVTFPDGSTVTTTADENGNFTVDVPAGVELKEGDKVTATATDGAGNTSTSAIVTVVSKGSSTGTTETGTENGNSANSGTEEVISKSTSETASQGNTVNNVSGAVKEATEDNKQAVLPKTGEESGAMSLIGLVALSGLGLLAFKRRRKEEE
ncbi:TPA: Ig-like domain-containing protein, partial [Streptococcus suis]